MPPHSWAAKDQNNFLVGHFPEYLAEGEKSGKSGKKNQSHIKFWAKLEEQWFARWSERAALIAAGKLPAGNVILNPEQEKLIADATDQRIKVRTSISLRDVISLPGMDHSNCACGLRTPNRNCAGQETFLKPSYTISPTTVQPG